MLPNFLFHSGSKISSLFELLPEFDWTGAGHIKLAFLLGSKLQ